MKKDRMVGSRLPEELINDLETIESVEQTDRSSVIRKLLQKAVLDWKIDYYARQYGDGRISRAKAAEKAGVSIWEMMDYTRAKKISAQYDLGDLKHDFEVITRKSKESSGI